MIACAAVETNLFRLCWKLWQSVAQPVIQPRARRSMLMPFSDWLLITNGRQPFVGLLMQQERKIFKVATTVEN